MSVSSSLSPLPFFFLMVFLVSAGAYSLGDVGSLIPNRFIISLKEIKNKRDIADAVESLQLFFAEAEAEAEAGDASEEEFRWIRSFDELVSYSSDGRTRLPHILAELSSSGLSRISSHPLVHSVEQDQVMGILESSSSEFNETCHREENPPWGLSRINQRGSFDDGSYFYNNTNQLGDNVDVYVIDSGIYCENVDFVNKVGGDCTYGIDLVDGSNEDTNGHGTHCAGTVGSATYGVAKASNLIAVRVLNRFGAGSNSDIISGINWVITEAASTGRKSIASLSLGGEYSPSLNSAVDAAATSGVLMVVAAGNSAIDACDVSPASAEYAFTVGATDSDDNFAYYSNGGPCVSILAPGSSVLSTYIGSPDSVAYLSGTSMSAPHVAGVAAVYYSQGEYTQTRAEIEEQLLQEATMNVTRNIVNETTPEQQGTPNALVYVEPCGTDSNSHSMSAAAKVVRLGLNYLSVGFIVLTSLNFGLQTSFSAMKAMIVDNKGKYVAIIILQCFTTILLCLISTKALGVHFTKMMAVFFVSLFPGGMIPNLSFVKKEQRNFRLSAVVTLLQHFIAVLSVPLVLVVLWSSRSEGVQEADMSWERLVVAVLLMLLLSLVGLSLRKCLSVSSTQSTLAACRDMSTAFSIVILFLALLLYGAKLLRVSVSLLFVAAFVQMGSGFAGVMTASLFNSKVSHRITLGTEFAFRNSGLAIAVVSFAFTGDLREKMIVFALLYSFVASVLSLILKPILKSCISNKNELRLEDQLIAMEESSTSSSTRNRNDLVVSQRAF